MALCMDITQGCDYDGRPVLMPCYQQAVDRLVVDDRGTPAVVDLCVQHTNDWLRNAVFADQAMWVAQDMRLVEIQRNAAAG